MMITMGLMLMARQKGRRTVPLLTDTTKLDLTIPLTLPTKSYHALDNGLPSNPRRR